MFNFNFDFVVFAFVDVVGVVATVVGGVSGGQADGTGSQATFLYPMGVAVDSLGTVYVADNNNHKIRRITPAGVNSKWH